jgi:hypothetical protein
VPQSVRGDECGSEDSVRKFRRYSTGNSTRSRLLGKLFARSLPLGLDRAGLVEHFHYILGELLQTVRISDVPQRGTLSLASAATPPRLGAFDPNATLTSFLVTKAPAKARDRYGRRNSYDCRARPETIVELDV